MIWALWNGGSGYGPSDLVSDLESFASLEDARQALRSRRDYGYGFRQSFEFVNRDPESVFTPCVEDDSSMWVWFGADVVDGVTYVPEYPDRVVSFGPRGGVRVEHA
jgi:hypothetical protein